MAYDKTFKINNVDLSPYMHDKGPTIIDNPQWGLSSEYTADGIEHVDFIGFRKTINAPFNAVTEAERKIIIDLYKSGVQLLTTYNIDTGADETFTVKPTGITSFFNISKYEIGTLSFGVL